MFHQITGDTSYFFKLLAAMSVSLDSILSSSSSVMRVQHKDDASSYLIIVCGVTRLSVCPFLEGDQFQIST